MTNLANEFLECISHLVLMCGQCIAFTLWHDGPFIKFPWCSYGGEVNVVGVYSGLEEGVGHVHLAKHFSLPTIGKYIIYAG